MSQEVFKIVRRLEDGYADYFDVERLGVLANEGDLYASLEYGICLYLGEQVFEDKEKSYTYFEKASASDDFNILFELVSFMNYVEDSRFKELIDKGMKRYVKRWKIRLKN